MPFLAVEVWDESSFAAAVASTVPVRLLVKEGVRDLWLDPARTYEFHCDVEILGRGCDFKGATVRFFGDAYVEHAVLRVGKAGHENDYGADSMEVVGKKRSTHRFKHCSFAHGGDSLADLVRIDDCTFELCTFAEALIEDDGTRSKKFHSALGLCGIRPGGKASYIYCLIVSCQSRTPVVGIDYDVDGSPNKDQDKAAKFMLHGCHWVNCQNGPLIQSTDYVPLSPFKGGPFRIEASITSCSAQGGRDVPNVPYLVACNSSIHTAYAESNEIMGNDPDVEPVWFNNGTVELGFDYTRFRKRTPFWWSRAARSPASARAIVQAKAGAWVDGVVGGTRHSHAERIVRQMSNGLAKVVARPPALEPTVQEAA